MSRFKRAYTEETQGNIRHRLWGDYWLKADMLKELQRCYALLELAEKMAEHYTVLELRIFSNIGRNILDIGKEASEFLAALEK